MKDFDTSVKKLDEYRKEELEALLLACDTFKRTVEAFHKDESPIITRTMDLWSYRIQEALKNKRKEN